MSEYATNVCLCLLCCTNEIEKPASMFFAIFSHRDRSHYYIFCSTFSIHSILLAISSIIRPYTAYCNFDMAFTLIQLRFHGLDRRATIVVIGHAVCLPLSVYVYNYYSVESMQHFKRMHTAHTQQHRILLFMSVNLEKNAVY